MGKFREWLREAESKETIKEETEYQKFFSKKLEKFGVKSPAELSDEDKKKFFSEIEAEWKGEKKEKPEEDDVNESKVDLSRVKYGNFWSDVLEIIGEEAVGGFVSEGLEPFLTRVLQYAAKLELEHLEDQKDDMDEDNYSSIKKSALSLSKSKIKIV